MLQSEYVRVAKRTLVALSRNRKLSALLVLILSALGFLIYWGGYILILWLLCAALYGLYRLQDALLYVPELGGAYSRSPSGNPGFAHPGEWGMPYSNLPVVTSDGVKLGCWLMLQPAALLPSAPTIIVFHGNSGNIGFGLMVYVQFYTTLHANVVAVDYRGYGDSEGKPSHGGLQKDAQAVLDEVLKLSNIDHSRIYLYGSSLGGAVALDLASKPQNRSKIAGVVVENTFTEIAALATDLFSPLRWFKNKLWLLRPVVRSPWRSLAKVSQVEAPILFISGDKDELIPPAHMYELYRTARQRKVPAHLATSPLVSANEGESAYQTFYPVEGGGHNTTVFVSPGDYYGVVKAFVNGDRKKLLTLVSTTKNPPSS